jgi:DNA repair protein RadC
MESQKNITQIENSLDAFRHLSPYFSWQQEEVYVIALNSRNIVIETVDFCLFHPRDILRLAISRNASGFILAHNHPSGDSTPSYQDIQVTKKLIKSSQLLQINFIDHLVLSQYSYASLKDKEIFKKSKQ